MGIRPSERWNLASAFDTTYRRLLLFGGGSGTYSDNTTWYVNDDV
jgi:hypothetical protein